MGYTKEAFVEPSTAPSALPSIMKEEAVIDPYRSNRPSPKKVESLNTNGAAAESAKNEETVTLSPGAAALARKEQKFRQDELRLKQEREALKEREAKIAKYEAMDAKLAKDDYSALDGVVKYDKYAQYEIDKLASTDPTQARLKELEQKIENEKREREEQVSKQFDAAVNERKTAATKLLETDPELSAFKSKVEKSMPGLKLPDAVTHHILETWEHDSKELSVEEATKEVVEALKEKAKGWSALLEEPKIAAEGEKKQLPPMKPSLKTITNQVTAGSLKAPVKSLENMSDSERYAEARRRVLERSQQKSS